jgi:hypothetical protein
VEKAKDYRLQPELFTEVDPANLGVLYQFVRRPGSQYLAFGHDISTVGYPECFANIVVGDKNANPLALQIKNKFANVLDRYWIYTGKRLI